MEEIFVTVEAIIFHHVTARPSGAHRPNAVHSVGRCRPAVDVREVMDRPAFGAIMNFGCLLTKGNEAFEIIEKRQVAFR